MRAAILLATTVSAFAAEFRFDPHRFTVPDGYILEKVASSPLVDRPVNMAFDETGALYVTDSSGSNEKPSEQVRNPTHRVVKLVDSNGDGVFDKQTVFAGKLSFPEGAMWLDGSLYVAAPPVIWKFTDNDRDGVAEKREVWYDGKTLTGCANDLHGPYAGPDGFIYWCKGAWEEQRHRLADGREFVSRASHIFRQRPDGTGREVVITGGMDNPVDVTFSFTGERFLCGTFFVHPGGGERDGILHAVHGGVWGKEHGPLEGHPRTGALMPIMTHLGPAAASGLEFIRSDGAGMRGSLLCTQFNMRKVSRHVLVQGGSTYRTQQSDLIVSDEADFHPTDVLEDADGSILIADTGGWYKLCCPTSKELKPEVLGAIYRLRKKDAVKRDDPRGLSLHWAENLIEKLDDPRHEVANRAIAELARRRETTALSASKSINALWALIRIDSPDARRAIRDALNDSQRRAVAIYGAGLWRDREAARSLVEFLKSPDPLTRRIACEALGRIGTRSAAPAIRAMEMQDRFLFHTAAYALYEIGEALDGNSDLARTVNTMLSLPKPAMARALPLVTPAAPPDQETLKRWNSRLDELLAQTRNGDAKKGAELFKSSRALCSTCHAINKDGGTLGPDLTKIGGIRTSRDLLEAIAFPSASYVRSYEPRIVRTKNGEHLGIITSEGPESIALKTGATTSATIVRDEITGISESPVSMMPPGYDGILTPQELADLIAFLGSSR